MLVWTTLRKLLSLSFWTKSLCIVLVLCIPLYSGSWADEKLRTLSIDEKIAQLIMVPLYTDGPKSNLASVTKLLEQYSIGAIVCMQGTIENQQKALVELQKKSKIPLLVGQDNEWGLDMRLKGALRFPRNLTLGALTNNQLLYELGSEIANQCQGVGVHINFGPVIDVNNNPENTVINDRAFGEEVSNVTQKGLLWMKGLQDHGVIACGKHFPGHGDTATDSHFALPVICKTTIDLEKLEWKPFEKLIDQGLQSIMMAHLQLPAISSCPTSLCPVTIKQYLRKNLNFQGLIFTDALNMNAIADYAQNTQAEVLALKAGNDILVWPQDPAKAIQEIAKAVACGEISENELNEHVYKILLAKEKLNLHQKLYSFDQHPLFSASALKLKERLFKESITLVKKQNNALPLNQHKKTAFIQIGHNVSIKDALELIKNPTFEFADTKLPPPCFNYLNSQMEIDYFFLPQNSTIEAAHSLLKKIEGYSQVVIGIYQITKYANQNYGLHKSALDFLDAIMKIPLKKYLCIFGSPYTLKFFNQGDVILMGYENDSDAQVGCCEILLGKRKAIGRLPVTASSNYPVGTFVQN